MPLRIWEAIGNSDQHDYNSDVRRMGSILEMPAAQPEAEVRYAWRCEINSSADIFDCDVYGIALL